jgi:flagellar biosynthetic protein FlhB
MYEENSSSQERTEAPTPRRREKAREEGQVARSQELSTAAVVLAGTLALATLGAPALAGYATRLMRASARALSGGPLAPAGAISLLQGTTAGLLLALLPFTLAFAGAVTLVNLAQARGVVSWQPVSPKLSNVSPLRGLKRLFSPEAAFAIFKSVAKLAILGLVTWSVLARSWPELASLPQAGPAEAAAVLRSVLVRLALMTGLAYLALALADYGFQRWRFERGLRMTRQELVYEHRETEGDPHVKARLQALARARARRRMLQRVPQADVVVVNPTEIAVALKYDIERALAPVVVAMGQRKLAERIKALALKCGVPVIENRPVARALLATATVGKPIPPALYAAVAEILAFVYRQRGRIPQALLGARRGA